MKEKSEFLFYNELTEKEKKSLTVETYVKGNFVATLARNNMKFFYFITDGEIRVLKNMNDKAIYYPHKPMKNYLLGANIFWAEVNLSFDFICNSEKLELIKIPIGVIERLKHDSLEFNSYVHSIAIEFFKVYWLVNHIKSIHGNEGFIAYILELESKNNYIYIKNLNDFIKSLNISSVGFYKILNKFIDSQIINKEGNSIKILNHKKLISLYDDSNLKS